MRYFWKFLTLLLFFGLNRPVPAYFDGGFEQYWTASTSVYDDGERVYATGTTEAPFEVFWTQVSTSVNGPGGGASGYDHSYGSWAGVQVSVPINGNCGYYSAYSTHAVMDTDGLADYDYSQGYDYVQGPPPPPPPTISGVSPSPAFQGTSRSIQVSGSGFRPGATLNSANSGLSISGSYVSDTTINGSYTATPGTYNISVSQDSGSASAEFTVYEATPIVSSVYPSTWQAGTVYPNAVVSGSFLGTVCPTITLIGAGNSLFSPTSCSDTSVYGVLTVDPNAPGGNATLTLSANGYGQGFQGPGGASNQGSTTAGVCPIPVLQVTSNGSLVGSGSTVFISPDPQMPAISAALLPGAPGCSLTGTASYQLSTTYYGQSFAYPYGPAAPQPASQPFNVPTSSFYGGDASLNWYYNGIWRPSFGFAIRGQNPGSATVGGTTPGWLTNIANHESGMRQFAAGTGLPLKDAANGYGIMQLTNPVPTEDQRWNWRSNVAAGQALLNANMSAAASFWQIQFDQWNTYNATHSNKIGPAKDRWESGSCTFSMTANGITFDQAIGLKRYAGVGSPAYDFISWNNVSNRDSPSWSVHPENGVRPDIVFEFCTCATAGGCQPSGVGHDVN